MLMVINIMWRLVVLWIVVFMILVILHEFWHFMAARKCWMKVPEFWIWLPPKICNLWKDKQWTQFTLNWIPLWWFCQIEWDNPDDKESFKKPNTLFTAKLWKRLIVLFAWVTMNFLTAFIIFVWLFRHWVRPLSVSQIAEDKWSTSYLMASSSFLRDRWFLTWEVESGVLVEEVMPWWLWEQIDLRQDDVLLEFDWIKLDFSNFLDLMASWANQTHTFLIQRWDIEVVSEEFMCEEGCKFDILIAENWNIELSDIKFWFWWAILAAFHEIWAERNLTMDALWILWRGLISFNKWEMQEALNSLSWPVGAVKIWWMFYEMWGRNAYLAFAAIISLALAIFNILPIPALDWWRVVWMILQSVFKIKPEKYFKYEWYVNAFFFYLILVLWVILIFKDLIVFWWVNIPFIS